MPEVDSRNCRPRAWLGFVKLIRNGLRKIKNWILRKIMAERDNEVRLQEREDGML